MNLKVKGDMGELLRVVKSILRIKEYHDCVPQILACKLVRPRYKELRRSLMRYRHILVILTGYDVIPSKQMRDQIVWWTKIDIAVEDYQKAFKEAKQYLPTKERKLFTAVVQITGSVVLGYLKGAVSEYSVYLLWKDVFNKEYQEGIEYLDHWIRVMEDFHTRKVSKWVMW